MAALPVNSAPAISASTALVYTPLRSALNMCHWHIAPSINDATASPHSGNIPNTQQAGAIIYSDENNSGAFFMEVKSNVYADLGVRAFPNVLVGVNI